MSDIFYIESGKFPSPCEATRNKMWCVEGWGCIRNTSRSWYNREAVIRLWV